MDGVAGACEVVGEEGVDPEEEIERNTPPRKEAAPPPGAAVDGEAAEADRLEGVGLMGGFGAVTVAGGPP